MSISLFVLVFNIFSKEPVTTAIVDAKSEDGIFEESNDDEKSEKIEDDEKSETSEDYLSEESYGNSATATTTEVSAASVGNNKIQEANETMTKTEMKNEASEEKIQIKNEVKEQARNTTQIIEGFDTVVLVDDNKAIVKNHEKLFGIFKISIESNVELDDNGNVKNTKQNIWNKFLAMISV